MEFNYVPRLSSNGLLTLPYYNQPPNPFTPLRVHKNCTTYAYGRWLEIAKGDVSKLNGLLYSRKPSNGTWNAGAWYACSTQSVQAGKGPPQLGDIACWSIGNTWNGHVAVVEELHTDYVVMSQSEYHGVLFHVTQNYAKYDYMGKWYRDRGYILRGFLRMQGVPSTPLPPNFDMPTEWVHYPSYLSMTEDDRQNNAVMAAVQLQSYGWTLEAIAGAIGNFVRESNLDPEATGTGGGGLVGWTPLTNYTRWSSYYGYTWYDGTRQIEFINMGVYCTGYDPNTGEPLLAAQWLPGRVDGLQYSDYKQMTQTPEEMAELFMRGYEAPGVPALDERKANARKYYDFLMGINLPFWNFPLNQPYLDGLSVWQLAGNEKPKIIY